MAVFESQQNAIPNIIGGLFQAHPWHGVAIGENAPIEVNTYIEVVPTDTVKYELDKDSGHLRIDRPQLYSNTCPAPYGLVPQTLCAERVSERCMERTGRRGVIGDGDPIDICVFSERSIPHGNLFLTAKVIGGLRMLDGGEADDKLIAVMKNDPVFGNWSDLSDCPRAFIDRLNHYFLTYKTRPGATSSPTEIVEEYGFEEAQLMLNLAHQDYRDAYGAKHRMLARSLSDRDSQTIPVSVSRPGIFGDSL